MFKKFFFAKWAVLFARNSNLQNQTVFVYNDSEYGRDMYGLCEKSSLPLIQKIHTDAKEVKHSFTYVD